MANTTKVKDLKVAICSRGWVYILIKDGAGKRILGPLNQERKNKLYPGIDALPPRKIENTLGLYPGLGLVMYDNEKTHKATRKIRKNASSSEKEDAIITLCSAPKILENQRSGYIVLSVSLLAQVIHLLPSGTLSEVPAVYCGDLLDAPPFLCTLLSAVNGPDVVRGSSYSLMRPSCLVAQYTSPTSPHHSLAPLDYLGGKLELNGKKYRFWLPLWATSVCIAPGLPPSVQSAILTASPSVIPFYCNKTAGKSKWAISIPGSDLFAADPNALQGLKAKGPLIHAIIASFLRDATKYPEDFRASFPDMNGLYSNVHFSKQTVGAPTAETRILATALATLRCFLNYSVEKGWLSNENRIQLLSDAQANLLPGNNSSLTEAVTGQWDSEAAFWPFLVEYLSSSADMIYVQNDRCPSGSIAAVRQLGKAGFHLILPRFRVVEAYHEYCTSHGLSTGWSGVELSRAILQWFPSLKKEKDNSGWQYNFYRDDDVPQEQKSPKLACLGFPVDELPEVVRKALPQAPCDV